MGLSASGRSGYLRDWGFDCDGEVHVFPRLGTLRTAGEFDGTALAGPEPPLLPAAGTPPLREFHRRQPLAPLAPAATFLQYLRLLPLGRRPGRRGGRPQAKPGPAGLVGTALARLLPRPDVPPRLHRPGHHDQEVRHPRRALRRSAGGLPPGPAGATLRGHRQTVELLPLFGQSRGPAGPLLGTVSHARAGADGRLDLHRAAVGQLLPGRGGRFRSRADLPAAGRLPPLRLRRRHVCAPRVQRRVPPTDGRRGRPGRRLPAARPAAGAGDAVGLAA